MCGIIGLLGREGIALRLVEGLARLKYRGRDSAVGKLDRLRAVLDGAMPKGVLGWVIPAGPRMALRLSQAPILTKSAARRWCITELWRTTRRCAKS